MWRKWDQFYCACVTLIAYILCNDQWILPIFGTQVKKTNTFCSKTGIVSFFLLFEQYGVKILITWFWDTQYMDILCSFRVCFFFFFLCEELRTCPITFQNSTKMACPPPIRGPIVIEIIILPLRSRRLHDFCMHIDLWQISSANISTSWYPNTWWMYVM